MSKASRRAARDRLGQRLTPTGWLWICVIILVSVLLPVSAATNTGALGMPAAIGLALAALGTGGIVLTVFLPVGGLVLTLAAAAAVLFISAVPTDMPWPWTVPGMFIQLSVLVLLALRSSWLIASAGWLVSVAVPFVAVLVVSMGGGVGDGAAANQVVFASVSLGVVTIAMLIRQRRSIRAQLLQERELTAAQRAEREMTLEKTRIARELHDVVAHSMSVINVQASSAVYRLPGLDDAVAAEFDQIAASARRALGEMRSLLGVLRSEESDTAIAPVPDLARLPELVESAAAAGVRVDLRVDPALADPALESRSVSQITAATAYRIVQEALSNVIRHAGGADTTVTLTPKGDALIIEVVNTAPTPRAARGARTNAAVPIPPPPPPPATDTGGHGLRGMRERAAILGGRVEAGPHDGGYRVRAELPLHTDTPISTDSPHSTNPPISTESPISTDTQEPPT